MLEESFLPKLHDLHQPSFDILFKEVFPPLLMYTQKITKNAVESEDIALNAFTILWEGIKVKNLRFNSVPQIRAYIYFTARNEAISFLRSRKAQQRYKHFAMSDTQQEDFTEYYALWSLIVNEIYKEIENLPDKCREVIKLCYFSGLSRSEVANMLNLSVNTVNSHCKYGIKLLRNVFSEKDLALFSIFLMHLYENRSLF